MTEKKQSREMGIGPSTKKLKSMLKILAEHGVARYKDSEFEIELAVGYSTQKIEAEPAPFNFGDYDQDTDQDKELKPRDDLGFTDEDYLFRSADT